MEQLTATHWALLASGALIMGMSKGGLPGAGNLTVAIYALTLEDALGPQGIPLSVGLLLPVLISADIAATFVYRRHAEWKYVVRLLPFFLVGIFLGWRIFGYFQVDEGRVETLKIAIGTILLSMTALHFLMKWRRQKRENVEKTCDDAGTQAPGGLALGAFLGLLGGVATMLANAAGPVAQLYLLAMALPKYAFIGTSAWLFLIVNVSKVPFMMDLEIITLESMSVSWWMFIPAVFGACVAPSVVRYLNQKLFEALVWFFIVLAGLRMVF